MKCKKTRKNSIATDKLSVSAAVMLAALGSAPAWSIMIDTGNPDASLTWSTQVRYNLGWRLEDINPHFANAFGSDETETRFKKHDLITNRLDVTSDVDYKVGRNGVRVSAALWSENAYPSTSHTSDSINNARDKNGNLIYTGANTAPFSIFGPSGKYSAFAKRYVTGSSGEILDAFVFGGFDLGTTSMSFKLGQHTVYWGESTFAVADGVAFGQGPLDGIKASTSPGADVKELFLPSNQLSFNWALTNELSLMGLYTLDWKPMRAAPGGTYFGASDAAGNLAAADPVCANTGPAGECTKYLDPVTPGRKGGNFGLALRWAPAWLDGTAGLYYRKFDEKTPWSSVQLEGGLAGIATNNIGVRLSYARDTELLGVSLTKNIGTVNGVLELSYRRNTGLNSVTFFSGSQGYGQGIDYLFAPNNVFVPLNQTPAYSQVEGARGNTYHAVLGGTYLLPKTALWETGNMVAEFSYQRLDKVTKNPGLFYSEGEGYACKLGYTLGRVAPNLNKTDGCSTKDALSFNMRIEPQWLQVFPSVDLSMPTSVSYGLHGNSPALNGAFEGTYNWSIALNAVYNAVYEFGVMLTDSHAGYKTAAADAGYGVPGQQILSTSTAANGVFPIANNHRWLSMHFKTSF